MKYTLQAFKTKEQLLTHNCDQSNESKKHTSSQLPKKASGSFKPRKPTPKRQTSSKTAIGLADKEKLEKFKADDIHRKVMDLSLCIDRIVNQFRVFIYLFC